MARETNARFFCGPTILQGVIVFSYFSRSFTRVVMSVGCRSSCAIQFGTFEAGCAFGGVGAACHVRPPMYKMAISCFNLRKQITRQEKELQKQKTRKHEKH